VPEDRVAGYIKQTRGGRTLSELPERIRDGKSEMLKLIREGHVREAFDFVQAMPADLRSAVKPFFTHFTAGHTTEVVTARSAADIIQAFVSGFAMALPAQVSVSGDWADSHDLSGVLGVLVLLGPREWAQVVSIELAPDEHAAMKVAVASIAEAAELEG